MTWDRVSWEAGDMEMDLPNMRAMAADPAGRAILVRLHRQVLAALPKMNLEQRSEVEPIAHDMRKALGEVSA